MIKFLKLEMKNFLSIGNVKQEIIFEKHKICLIIGENLDVNFGTGSRNGVGKTTIIQGLSYVLFGNPLTSIKKDNLINKINGKNMYVSVEFSKNDTFYKIERGRKPNFLNFYVNNSLVKNPDTNESEGENKWTQNEIEKVLGISHYLFKYLIAMNTFTEPFLSLPVSNQRQFIEDLLGIKQLSLKSEALKANIKKTEQLIQNEEIRIKTIIESNSKIEKTIEEISRKSLLWNNERERKLKEINNNLHKLINLNIEEEIKKHEYKEILKNLEKNYKNFYNNFKTNENLFLVNKKKLEALTEEISELENNKCPTCKRPFHDSNITTILEEKKKILQDFHREYESSKSNYEKVKNEFEEYKSNINLIKDINLETCYDSLQEVYEHKSIIESLERERERILEQTNPFEEQITSLRKNSIQKVNYDKLNKLVYLLDKQKLLLKLLVNKDSFIRKRIIDQNLQYLNKQLRYYCTALNIVHELKFLNDFNMEIKIFSIEYDFDNLSRGEKTRVVLALNFAFRDLYETITNSFNILIIDELIDNGLDNFGIESVMEVLKTIATERRKNIFVVSHRDELINKVDDVLYVVKENNFTTIISLN